VPPPTQGVIVLLLPLALGGVIARRRVAHSLAYCVSRCVCCAPAVAIDGVVRRGAAHAPSQWESGGAHSVRHQQVKQDSQKVCLYAPKPANERPRQTFAMNRWREIKSTRELQSQSWVERGRGGSECVERKLPRTHTNNTRTHTHTHTHTFTLARASATRMDGVGSPLCCHFIRMLQ